MFRDFTRRQKLLAIVTCACVSWAIVIALIGAAVHFSGWAE